METDAGKLFVGGISWETTEERLKEYFEQYGEVVETVIMKDRTTGRARGFGFVIFADPSVAEMVVQEKHTIDGRQVEAKKAVPREEQHQGVRGSPGSGGYGAAAASFRTKKIFVGGLASTVTEDDFRKYFEQFGTITDVVVMYDHQTQRPRGFGFITFDNEGAVEAVLAKSFHELNGKTVEVKRAVPKELSPPAVGRGVRGFAGSPGASYGAGGGYGLRGDRFAGRGSNYGSYAGRSYGGYGSSSFGSGLEGSGYSDGGYGSGLGSAGYGAAGYGSLGAASRGYGTAGSGYGASGYGASPGYTGYGSSSYGYGSGSPAEAYGASAYERLRATTSSRGRDTYGGGASSSAYGTSAEDYGSYGSSLYDQSTWGGGASVPTSTGAASYGSGYADAGGYGIAGRQLPRAPDDRYRPYPSSSGGR